MSRSACLLVLLAGVLVGVSVGQASNNKVVYGVDNRQDIYTVTEPNLLKMADSVVGLVYRSSLSRNSDGSYRLFTDSFTSINGCGQLCTTERFRGQLLGPWCSGFLVERKKIVTAGHCFDGLSCSNAAFVFGFQQQSATLSPNVTHIPADNVYFCKQFLYWINTNSQDYGVVELDRYVMTHNVASIRRSGQVPVDTPLFIIGHPSGLPMKYSPGAEVKANFVSTSYFLANLDSYGGNSGSLVANADTLEVEGILVRGNEDYSFSGGCCSSAVCSDDTGCPSFEESTKISEVLPYVRPIDRLLVDPEAPTVHHVIGDTASYNVTYYLFSEKPITVSISLIANTFGPLSINGGVTNQTGIPLTSGTYVTVNVVVNPSQVPLGLAYSMKLVFRDETTGFTETKVHTVRSPICGDGICDISEEENCGSCPVDCCANDACQQAITVTSSNTLVASNAESATPTTFQPACRSSSAPNITGVPLWYNFFAATSGELVVSTCHENTQFDTVLAVYDTCDALSTVDCNDDAVECTGSLLRMSVQAGQSLLFRVSGYSDTTVGYVATVFNFTPDTPTQPTEGTSDTSPATTATASSTTATVATTATATPTSAAPATSTSAAPATTGSSSTENNLVSPDDSSGGLSSTSIIIIAVVAGVVGLLLLVIIVVAVINVSKKRQAAQSTNVPEGGEKGAYAVQMTTIQASSEATNNKPDTQ